MGSDRTKGAMNRAASRLCQQLLNTAFKLVCVLMVIIALAILTGHVQLLAVCYIPTFQADYW
jgi:hypothetical protein